LQAGRAVVDQRPKNILCRSRFASNRARWAVQGSRELLGAASIRFAGSAERAGWVAARCSIKALSNFKQGPEDETGARSGLVIALRCRRWEDMGIRSMLVFQRSVRRDCCLMAESCHVSGSRHASTCNCPGQVRAPRLESYDRPI
jgi:hypothetical protein